jgi:hypothetical protein
VGACRFYLTDKNPNDTVGGGGCACGETKPADQKGPFAVFPANEMDCGYSPHLVVCAPCAASIATGAEGEVLTTPQGDVLESTAEEISLDTIADEDIPEL